ncbi:diadenylate cyclase CdaA [Candidatus Auribacterota bacterium]
MHILNTIREWIYTIGWMGFLDIFILALIIYAVLLWFRRTKAAYVLTGIVIVAVLYLIVQQLNLEMTVDVFEKFFAVFLIAIVVIFQEELRAFFEKVALFSTRKRDLKRRSAYSYNERYIQTLVRAVVDMSGSKTGALIVMKGKDHIQRHIDGGVELEGIISEPLLLSIFDAGSPGHDGAVVIDNERVKLFAVHLPLSRNLAEAGKGGTRHSAGLGLTELCDALCVIVSEERGGISVAYKGKLKKLSAGEELIDILRQFYEEIFPVKKRSWTYYLRRNYREKAIAVCLAAGLWFVNVHGSKIVYHTIPVPVSHIEISNEWTVKDMMPKYVDVTFHAPRSSIYFASKDDVKLVIPLRMKEGKQGVRIYPKDFKYPRDFILDHYKPLHIDVELNKKAKKK